MAQENKPDEGKISDGVCPFLAVAKCVSSGELDFVTEHGAMCLLSKCALWDGIRDMCSIKAISHRLMDIAAGGE